HISGIGEPTSSWQQADRRRSQHPSTVVGDTSSGRSTNTGDLSSSLLILQDQGTRNETAKEVIGKHQDELAMLSDDYEELDKQREQVTENYDNAIASAIQLQESFATNTKITLSENNHDESKIIQVNLPKIDLPKFDGRIEHWVTFKDAFQTMIHTHTGLSNIQKLNYLKLSLSGRAEIAIGAFTISDENYEAAWKHLTEIYDNKRALVLRHAALLRDTSAMSNDSSESIRDLANYMQLHIRSLEALGRKKEDIANDLLTSILISRMGKETRKTWERTLSDTEVPKIDDIFKFMHMASHQCKDYETVSYNNHQRQENTHQKSHSNNNRAKYNPPKRNSPPPSPRSVRRVFNTAIQFPTCGICKSGSHAAFQCKSFLDASVEKRIELVRKSNLCYNCLKPGHSHNTCRGGRCKKCNLPHNTHLHLDRKSDRPKLESRDDTTSTENTDP
ncbi:uncharacterized protein LOC143364715, partial [Halictus rubicundus]|uniref:uncharacterized protein LOC143364715 n=1 Tax=Halictus rubicundus TaxID=77578 RepID=UPI004036A453